MHTAATRARADLDSAKAKLAAAEADERKARADKKCKADCLTRWSAAVTTARQRVSEAKQIVRGIEAKAVTEAASKAPVWLPGAAIDAVAFGCLWLAFAPVPVAPKVQAKQVKATRKPAKAKPRKRPANDNVLPLRVVR